MENLPALESRRNRRSSTDCLRISRSNVLLIAKRDELLISRSSTFRSRRAFAASSFIFWSCSAGGCGRDADLLGLWRGEAWADTGPVSSVNDDASVDTKLVELDVERSGEFGDVVDTPSCCVGVPLGVTTSTCRLIAVALGVLLLDIGVICAEVVLADFR